VAQISVIIPTFNRRGVITRAIDSVMQQSVNSVQLIIVDDGSTDGTSQMIAERYEPYLNAATEHKSIHLLAQNNQGVSAARNNGLRHANGEWIALLDSDDEWRADKLEVQLEALEQVGSRFCHSDEIWIRNGVRVNPMKKHRKRGGDIFPWCLRMCVVSPSSVLIHRSVFDELGDFDETLPVCEDYDYWLRYCCRYPVDFSPGQLVIKHGGHADQLSRRFHSMDRYRLQSLGKLLSAQVLSEPQRELAVAEMQRKARILLKGAIKHDNQALISEVDAVLVALNIDVSVPTSR